VDNPSALRNQRRAGDNNAKERDPALRFSDPALCCSQGSDWTEKLDRV